MNTVPVLVTIIQLTKLPPKIAYQLLTLKSESIGLSLYEPNLTGLFTWTSEYVVQYNLFPKLACPLNILIL